MLGCQCAQGFSHQQYPMYLCKMIKLLSKAFTKSQRLGVSSVQVIISLCRCCSTAAAACSSSMVKLRPIIGAFWKRGLGLVLVDVSSTKTEIALDNTDLRVVAGRVSFARGVTKS